MKKLLIKTSIIILNILYLFFKLFPASNKVTFISRQSDTESIDFILLKKEIKKRNKNIKTKVLCKKLNSGFIDKIKYCFHMLSQMYNISTSKVVVLDSYCMLISILKHKKSLNVIQIWHALGSYKKFGLSIINKTESISEHINMNSKELSEVMKMHKNYNILLTSSEDCLPHFSEAFGYPKEYFTILSLPRVDLFSDEKYIKEIRQEILKDYKELSEKENIIYAPTFRKDNSDEKYILDFINNFNYEKYNLILKLHPNTKMDINDNRVIIDNKYSSWQMCTVCKLAITDYSAFVYEASLLNVPLCFYIYDYDDYTYNRDFYISLDELPGKKYKAYKELFSDIEKNKFDLSLTKKFNYKFIKYKTNNTKKLTDIIYGFLS